MRKIRVLALALGLSGFAIVMSTAAVFADGIPGFP
jgi:hypothetical protein